MPRRQAFAVSGGGDDRLNVAAEIKQRARHDLVGPISEKGQPSDVGGLPGQYRPDRLVDQACRVRRQSPVSRDGYASQRSLSRKGGVYAPVKGAD